MKQPCGCCAGVEVVTPQSEANRPGLPALSYRVGTYATFLESMIARLSTVYLDIPVSPGSTALQRIYPLSTLTTRDPSDTSIALLDAWATVGDVLSFYQERIANEGYLGTALERRSILELARLVGYRLRPGVSATVYLAFTVADGFDGTIPAGTRAQSIPGPCQTPQFFETSDDLLSRDVWNTLKPRLTRPQAITLQMDAGTDAATRETVYFQGISTNLNAGDRMLFVLGEGSDQQVLRQVATVDAQADQKRTEVTLLEAPPATKTSVLDTITTALSPFLDEVSTIFSGSDIAQQVAQILQDLEGEIDATTSAGDAVRFIQNALPDLEQKHDLSLKRKFTRLEPWIGNILDTLNSLVQELQSFTAALPRSSPGAGTVVSGPGAAIETTSRVPLQGLLGILGTLSLPPSVQPPSSVQLARSVSAAFAPESDIAPRMLATFFPSAADTLYHAWASIQAPQEPPQVNAMRVKAGLFPGTFPGKATTTSQTGTGSNPTTTSTTSYDPPTISNAWGFASNPDPLPTIPLDAAYDKIVVGSWVAIDRPPVADAGKALANRTVTYHQVTGVVTVSMATFGYSAKSTQLTLNPAWLSDSLTGDDLEAAFGSPDFLHGTVVYAQSEPLDLAEEPLDTDVEGNTIELAQVYDGLDSGRWIIVSGERTDIPNVSGVAASELVMISAVAQSLNAPGVDQNPGLAKSAFSPAQPLHTILTLANDLAYTYDSNTVTIYANVVKATNGQTQGEVLGDGDASQSSQRFALHQSPLTYLPAPTPAGAQSTLTLRVNEVEWDEAGNLLSLGPTDRGFISRTDDNDQTTVIFGTGEHGMRVPTGTANVKAVYRTGTGRPGNVAAQQISQLATQPLGAKSVINPLAASGGADRDSRDQARRNAPLAVMALDRLVSVEDYADFARTFAGIGKAASARLSNGRQLIVHVTIAGKDDIPIDQNSDLYRNLVLALEQSGDPHQPLQVALRRLKLLVISAGVKVQAGYQWVSVAPNLRSALLDFFGFENRDLGQSAFLSEAISLMQGVAGVQYVNVQTFDSVAEGVNAAQLATLAARLRRRDVVRAELARVNANATDPRQRIAAAELAILTPDVPDTLILTEITA
jgi:hypothetical protein